MKLVISRSDGIIMTEATPLLIVNTVSKRDMVTVVSEGRKAFDCSIEGNTRLPFDVLEDIWNGSVICLPIAGRHLNICCAGSRDVELEFSGRVAIFFARRLVLFGVLVADYNGDFEALDMFDDGHVRFGVR